MTSYKGSLFSVDYSPINVLGRATINIYMDGKDISHNVLIANISKKGLLGLDFLQAHRMALDIAQ